VPFSFFTLIFLFARKQSPTGKKSVQPCLAKTYAMLNDELPNASQKRVSDPRPQSLSPKTPNVRLTTKRMFLSKSFAVKRIFGMSVNCPGSRTSMSDAPLEPKSRRDYQKHGDHTRSGRLRARGLAGIDGRTAEGREALAWRDNPLRAKGGAVHMPSRSRSSWPASIFSGSCICKVF